MTYIDHCVFIQSRCFPLVEVYCYSVSVRTWLDGNMRILIRGLCEICVLFQTGGESNAVASVNKQEGKYPVM
jgi:hypothetical protein